MSQANPSFPFRWTSRQVMLATVYVAAVVLGFWMVYRFRSVLLFLFVAIVIGTATRPAVDRLARLKVPRGLAEVLVYLALFLAILGFLLLVVPMILDQSTALVNLLSDYYEGFRRFMLLSPSRLLQRLGVRLPFELAVGNLVQPEAPAGAYPGPTEVQAAVEPVAQAFSYLGAGAWVLFSVVAIFLMSFYWTIEGDRAVRSLLLLVPGDYREEARGIIDTILEKLGGYLLGQGTLCLAIGVLQLIAYLIIGLPNALVLALIAGVLEAVPTVGPLLGAVPAILIASATDPSKVIWVLVSTAIIQLLENNLLVPRIMGRSVGVHPLLTLLSLAALSTLMGLAGALLAVPIAAIIQLAADRLLFKPDETPSPGGRDFLSYLRLQAQEISQDVRKQVRNKDEVVNRETDLLEDEIEALANDLDRVLVQAQPAENVP